ncbi:MAG: flagellar type III secretion system pore protein FliP [Candidatus Eremiobacteraeota bacterium]|nr:flagellar type III secretion system pore protein FliP [Candidatus Eremiobacteraeota bacterium]MCW5869187.1 flagellar type III secretion system pore protein FliP [Candidatus Eremiobacteraeota bacterium]
MLSLIAVPAHAQDFFNLKDFALPDIRIEPVKNSSVPTNLQISFFIISLSLIPYTIVSCTSFIRTTIMLSYLKSALGSTQALSNQLMMGITMFITFFIMWPVGQRIHQTAVQPYIAGALDQPAFIQAFAQPIRDYMLAQTRDEDIFLFTRLGRLPRPKTHADIPFRVIMPSYIMSEIKTGFFIGFLIYLPFLVVDMVVASVLMSMGMFMISPTTISLPFKLVLFTSLDGWHVLITGLVRSINHPPWWPH